MATSFSRKQFLSDTIIYTFGGALPQILNFLLLPLYSRLLYPDDFGILGYISSITAFITITNSLSLNSYYLRYYYEAQDRRKFTGTIFYFLILVNLFMVIIEGLLLNFIFQKTNVKIPFYPYMILGLAECFLTSISLIPLRRFRLEFKSLPYVLCTSGGVLMTHTIALILIKKFGMGAEGRLLGNVMAAGAMSVFYLIHTKSISRFIIDWEIIKNGLKFSLPLLGGAYASIALSVSDRLILERWVEVAAIGIYSVSYAISNVSSLIISSFSFVIEPLVYKISAENKENFLKEYLRLKDYFFPVVFIVVGGIMLFSNEIVKILLTPRFSTAADIIPLISFSTIFSAGSMLFGQLLMIKNKTFIISFATITAALISILLNLFIIPRWGILAAALTITIAQATSCLISYLTSAKTFSSLFYIKREIISGALLLAIVYILLPAFSEFNPLVIFAAKFLIYILFTLMLFKIYSIKFNSLLNLLISYVKERNFQ